MSSVFLSLGDEKKERMGTRRGRSPAIVNAMLGWLERQPMKVKCCLGAAFMVISLVALKLFVKKYAYFFIGSESIHAAGIIVLIYKLTTKNTCSGITDLPLYILSVQCFLLFTLSILLRLNDDLDLQGS